jgi:hypothetical protein
VFTARYALSPYIKQTFLVFKGLMEVSGQLLASATVHTGKSPDIL